MMQTLRHTDVPEFMAAYYNNAKIIKKAEIAIIKI